jgi:hypothetical protein
MKKNYIVDVLSRVYYGSYILPKEKEQMEKDIELVKYIADACVEEGTNVLIVEQDKLITEFSHYKHGSTYDLKKKIKELQNHHVEK